MFEFHSDIRTRPAAEPFPSSYPTHSSPRRPGIHCHIFAAAGLLVYIPEEIPEEPSGDEIKIAGITGGTLGRTLAKKPNVR